MNDTSITTVLVIIVIGIIGFYLGFLYSQYLIMKNLAGVITKMRSLLQDNKVNVPHVVAKLVVDLKHESIGDMNYFYTIEGDVFVCQANSLEEAAKLYQRSQENTVGRFTYTDGKQYIFVDGKVECVS